MYIIIIVSYVWWSIFIFNDNIIFFMIEKYVVNLLLKFVLESNYSIVCLYVVNKEI